MTNRAYVAPSSPCSSSVPSVATRAGGDVTPVGEVLEALLTISRKRSRADQLESILIDGARPPVALRGKPGAVQFVVLVEVLQETSRSQPRSPCMSAASASATEGESASGSRRREDPLTATVS